MWGGEGGAEKCVHTMNVPSVSSAALPKQLLSATGGPDRLHPFAAFIPASSSI